MESNVTPTELERVLSAFPSARIAVVGDVCLDVYKFLADESEISVETGLPTRIVESMRSSLGGAANVAANLASLGVGKVVLYGIIGDDLYGREVVEHCSRAGISTDGLVVQSSSWHTNVYTKLYKDEKEEPRIDLGTLNAANKVSVGMLLERLRADLSSFNAVIINQQLRNGIHTSVFRTGLAGLISEHAKLPVFLDSRDYPEDFPGTIRKLNLREAQAVLGRAEDPCTAALVLSERWQQPVYLTRGEEGCVVAEAGQAKVQPAPAIAGTVDPVGAGDSMIAGIVAARVSGLNAVQAAVFGGFVAGVTVRKLLRTGTATPDEIREIGQSPDYLYNPELAHSPHKARYIDSSDIEFVTELPEGGFTYAVFDHDGTISTVREGWEQVMEPLMCRVVLGPQFETAPPERHSTVRKAVREFIDRTTGYQTMYQMQILTEMVRDFGCVPPAEILTPAEYKELYNKELLAMVERRLVRFRAGELSVDDLTVKNAVPLLRALRKHGLVLYLASGTDEPDVRAEAKLLGYADLFNGGIFGSVGDVRRDPKRVVLERILHEIGSEKARGILTFGDGPVEIRETHKAGGYAVGVASDEVRRYGLNLAKRERLILAGADCVIPDYSQLDRLLEHLGMTPGRGPVRAAVHGASHG